jgi:hypothetical protein
MSGVKPKENNFFFCPDFFISRETWKVAVKCRWWRSIGRASLNVVLDAFDILKRDELGLPVSNVWMIQFHDIRT